MNPCGTRAIAFHLPQFHPIPENDAWWGKGFTEWTNVAKARPRFKGHYQPHLPADLGFYDLRLPEAREAQASLALEYGIHGFCYYHYWFNGRRILERPVDEILRTGRPNFPFCLCWANENWTRRWDGADEEILLKQVYSPQDDSNHFRSLLTYFRDERYILVNGKPLFLVYRASNLPDAAATVERWRSAAVAAGLPGVYLCNVESGSSEKGFTPSWGFDAAVEFAPDWDCINPMRPGRWRRIVQRILRGKDWNNNIVFDYKDLRDRMLDKPAVSYTRFPCVTPSWDNSARRKDGAHIAYDASPEKYEYWLRAVLEKSKAPSSGEDFIFINAWNEWAEGNHLEPCERWGLGYLEATRNAMLAKRD